VRVREEDPRGGYAGARAARWLRGRGRSLCTPTHSGGASSSYAQVWRNGEIRRLALVIALHGAGMWIPVVHIVRLALDRSVAPGRADQLLVFVAAGAVGFRVPLNVAADRLGRRPVFAAVAAAYAAADLAFALALNAPEVPFGGIAAFGLVAGACTGALNAMMPTLPPEVVPAHEMPHAVGLVSAMLGPGTIVGPVIAGAFSDATGSFSLGFVFAAAALATSSVVVLRLDRGAPRAAAAAARRCRCGEKRSKQEGASTASSGGGESA